MLFVFWLILVGFILIQQLCSSSLSVSPVTIFIEIYCKSTHFVTQILRSLLILQLHIEPLIFVWQLKMRILLCLSVYWHGSSCWSQHMVRTIIRTKQKLPQIVLWSTKQSLPGPLLLTVSPGISDTVCVPEPSSAGRRWRRHLGYNNCTCQGGVEGSKMFLECWAIFDSPSCTSILWKPHRGFWKGFWCPAAGLENWVLMSILNSEIKESDSH